MPAARQPTHEFWEMLEVLIALVADDEQAGSPISAGALRLKWPPSGFDLEARTQRQPGRPLFLDRVRVAMRTLFYYVILHFGLTVGRFRPQTYLREVTENSDFRKFDDGLRMTLDCSGAVADRIEALLADAASRNIARYGAFRQSDALITCFTPTVFGTHFHFIDGADGGYAMAARRLGK
jgi:hypothetical protein